ncbi:hypothetical protein Tco_0477164 [Tanacetum coccineum]
MVMFHSSSGPCCPKNSIVDTVIFNELEKKVKVLSKVNHAKAIEESVQANAINEVKNQLPKLLPKAVSDFVQPEWKEQFMIQKSRSFQDHEKHMDLYNALRKRHHVTKTKYHRLISEGKKKRKMKRDYDAVKRKRKQLDHQGNRSRNVATSHHEVYSRMKILSVIRITVDKQFGYGYLSEIVVRRAYQKEYTFKEADFSRLHSNYIEDMFLLYVQNKLHNLTGDEIVDLTYTTVYEPRGVVYLNKSNRKRLMRADDLYKFSDGTLKSVRDNQHEMLHNFVLGYNHGMPKRTWTDKDHKRTDVIVNMIANLLLERQIMRSLECFVGGRTVETDYRILMRTI